jgi:uncharacterized protein (TIGR03435 family)
MCRFLCLAVATLYTAASAQGPTRPSFDVASVKANRSADVRTGRALAGARFSMTNETLWRVIGEAHAAPEPLPRFRIIGGPDWINTERFDIEGVSQAQLTRDRARLMLQSLLAERFKLAVHTETRPLPIFELKFAREDGRLGPELRRRDAACAIQRSADDPLPARVCGIVFGFGRLTGTGMTVTDLAAHGLSRVTGRPVIDRTGLAGQFDWDLNWTPDNLPPRPAGLPADQPLTVNGQPVNPNGPTLATALQEQLGLKIESATGPVDVLVIDRVERPTEN